MNYYCYMYQKMEYMPTCDKYRVIYTQVWNNTNYMIN